MSLGATIWQVLGSEYKNVKPKLIEQSSEYSHEALLRLSTMPFQPL